MERILRVFNNKSNRKCRIRCISTRWRTKWELSSINMEIRCIEDKAWGIEWINNHIKDSGCKTTKCIGECRVCLCKGCLCKVCLCKECLCKGCLCRVCLCRVCLCKGCRVWLCKACMVCQCKVWVCKMDQIRAWTKIWTWWRRSKTRWSPKTIGSMIILIILTNLKHKHNNLKDNNNILKDLRILIASLRLDINYYFLIFL